LIYAPFVFLGILCYVVVAGFVWTVERDSAYSPDLAERQAILGRAIWWLPCLIYWGVTSIFKLVIFVIRSFYNATYQMLLSEFGK